MAVDAQLPCCHVAMLMYRSQSLWQCFEIKFSKSLAVIASMALKLFNFETLRTLYAANGQVSYEFKWFYR